MSGVDSVGTFVATSSGELHLMSFRPEAGERAGAVLVVPPFAEELNRSRRMIALAARACAARGVEVVLPDLYGTGDSEGDFAEATWERWGENLDAVWASLAARGHSRIVVLGLRSGALLGAELAARRSVAPLHVFWQPVTDGARFLEQFLRLRVAVSMVSTDPARESVAGLRQRLAAGEALEIAGYTVAPALAQALAGRTLAGALAGRATRIAWFEVGSSEALSPAATALAGRLKDAGHVLEQRAVAGPQFWTTLETTVAEALIEPTVAAVAALAGAA